MKKNTSIDGLCVVVSHYNARPNDELIRLLYQLKDQSIAYKSEFSTTLLVVVNCGNDSNLTLPDDLDFVIVQYRENTGFNIGSWDYGWRNNGQFKHYLFLQDECQLVDKKALLSYWNLLEKNPNTLFGESMFFYFGWTSFKQKWPEAFSAINVLAEGFSINLGISPTHLQTLILAASNTTMQKLDGFDYVNDKIQAIATEILLSRKALSKGINVRQSRWTPFFLISHPQWDDIREKSKKIKWSFSKLIWLNSYGLLERFRCSAHRVNAKK